ncbi:MAG: HIT family protein [Candidatus Paceibacterota bacterium]|jgi:diadenosine tetraphosphate (Ap4A) HIT family hydrolase
MSSLPKPPPKSIIYESEWLYVCLALFPITKGHVVVVWKKDMPDLHDLSDSEYDYLMEIVDITRDTLLKTLNLEKVYLMYMDEVKQVHWHLIPRYNEQGFDVFTHEPKENHDFPLVPDLQKAFLERLQTREIKLPKMF